MIRYQRANLSHFTKYPHSQEACRKSIDFEIYSLFFQSDCYLRSIFRTVLTRVLFWPFFSEIRLEDLLQMGLFMTLRSKSFSFRSFKWTGRRCWCPTEALPRTASPDGPASAMEKSTLRRNTRNCPTWQPHAGKSRVSLVSPRQAAGVGGLLSAVKTSRWQPWRGEGQIPGQHGYRAAAVCYGDIWGGVVQKKWPLMTLSSLRTGSSRPRRLLIVSWCNCDSGLSSPCSGDGRRSLLSGCDTLAGAGNEGKRPKSLKASLSRAVCRPSESLSVTAAQSWEPNGAYQIPAGSLQQLSGILQGEKGGLVSAEGKSWFWQGSRGAAPEADGFSDPGTKTFKLPAGLNFTTLLRVQRAGDYNKSHCGDFLK